MNDMNSMGVKVWLKIERNEIKDFAIIGILFFDKVYFDVPTFTLQAKFLFTSQD